MKLVVKIGGTLIQEDDARTLLALQIGGLLTSGHQVLAVHGGGAQITAFLKEAGIQPAFVEGRRVTSPQVLDAAVKVMAGSVNHELLAAFALAGVRACGISGIDGGCLLAARRNGGGPDLGLVGRIEHVRTDLFDALARAGFVPVLAPLAVSQGGQILNVNADEAAVACAAAWMADRLIFLTDVDGVRGADGAVLSELAVEEIERLIAGGVATDGMLAKLRAAQAAVAKGVPQVGIAPGRQPRILRRLLAGEAVGTSIRAAGAPIGSATHA
jgi:acetylglutamate kinase